MSTEMQKRDPVRDLVVQVRGDQFVEQLALALPETVSPRRFARIAVTAIQQNPDLANCSQPSVMQALLRCAADGLLPDGREAALVKYGDKAQYMPMIGGYRKIAADHGWVLRTRAVYANDEFDYNEEPPELTHRPAPLNEDRGDLVAAYAIATHKDGRRLQRVLDAGEIGKRREIARSKNVWQQWPAAMWEKTAGRDLFGELPLGDLDHARVARIVEADRAFEDASADPAAALYGHTNGGSPSATDDAALDAADAASAEATEEDGVWEALPSDAEVEQAAATTVPRGVYKGKTLAQVSELEEGPAWLLHQLKTVAQDAPARPSIETFVRVRLPETWASYEAHLAEQAS